jgi:hypothetical protein
MIVTNQVQHYLAEIEFSVRADQSLNRRLDSPPAVRHTL